MRIILAALGVALLGSAAARAETGPATGGIQETSVSKGFEAWLAGFRPRALAQGIGEATFEAAFRGVAPNPFVVEKDRNQAEFTRTIWDYLDRAVSEDRITFGQAALRRHTALFDRIEAAYGVDRAVVAAIWGLESSYGVNRGDIGTVEALATLAHDPRRAAFFETQLIAALKILQAGDVTPERMLGSWAGAMGHTQFMPTSFQTYAVDFTGDGKRDIWADDPADALASTAAYLARHGWQHGAIWGLEVTLPQGFDYSLSSDRLTKSVADWAALGVAPAAGGALPDHGPAVLRLPAGHRGAAFLTFANFRAIEAYNPADAYVIAVGHLADRLKGGGPIKAEWPREDRALTADERVELQRRLTDAGYDTGGVDGRIGPRTLAAVQAFQKARGLPQDGYPNPALLARLR